MFKDKYSNLLTIILVVLLVAVLAILTVLFVNVYNKYKKNKEANMAISDFDNSLLSNSINGQDDGDKTIDFNITDSSNGSASNKGTRKVKYYKGHVMIGYIEIPKIKIKYPILEEETVASLEQSVAVRYPEHATLNQVGNVVIVGHNYKNGLFFSNLKKVEVGDTVKITDANGTKLTYKVYDKYETTPEDFEYCIRDVGDNIEVTLVTCTDDSKARIILEAKV